MPQQGKQNTTLNPVSYFMIVGSYLRALFAARPPIVLGLYMQWMDDTGHIGEDIMTTRQCYRRYLQDRGFAPPDDQTLAAIERRYVLYFRLQAIWTLCWILLFPATYPVYALHRVFVHPVTWTPFMVVTFLPFVVVVTIVFMLLGFIVNNISQRFFAAICARMLALPGVLPRARV